MPRPTRKTAAAVPGNVDRTVHPPGGGGAPGGAAAARAAPTEAELAHFEGVMRMLKSRWAGLPAEARANMRMVNEDPARREESMGAFVKAWAAADSDSDGRLTRDEFRAFNRQHLRGVRAMLGWAPEITDADSERIWESLDRLDPEAGGVGLADYGRYHAVMKVHIN